MHILIMLGNSCNLKSSTAASTLWCASQLLEGISEVTLNDDNSPPIQDIYSHSKRLEMLEFAR